MQASRRLTLAVVFFSTLGVGLTFGLEPPLIALVLSRSGASSFAVGAVTGASLIAVIFLGPYYPRAISRLGLRACIMAGVGGSLFILLLMPVWPGVGVWFFLRLVTGCALGLSWISSEVWLNSLSGADARGTVMGIYGTVFSAGVMGGPALLELTGTHGWLPFVAGAACLAATLVPLGTLPRINRAAQEITSMRELGGALVRAPVIMLASFIAGLVESAELTLLPLFGVHAGFDDHKSLALVTVFMAGNVVLQMPIGLLADRLGRRFMVGFCALVSGIGPLLLQPLLATPLLWPLLFIWGGTLYAFYSQGVAMLGGKFAAAELTTANTMFVMVYCLGGVIGPSVGGVIMDVWPIHGLQTLLSGAAFVLLAGLLCGIRRRSTLRIDPGA